MDRTEALHELRSFIGQLTEGCREALETLIPELKESRDEQIRKAIIKSLDMPFPEDNLPGTDVTYKEAVAWLEKQKDHFRDDTKMVEQKPAEWSEDYREEDIQTRFAFYTYKDDPSVLYLSNVFVEETSRNHGFGTRILKAAEKAAEAIGAITICLKVKQDSPANAWYRKRGYGYVAFEDGYDWLEKNLEYLKPVKQEWSEEDTEMIMKIISSLRGYICTFDPDSKNHEAYIQKEIAWLKSLRPSWKPSEEQMAALKEASASWMNEKMGNAELLQSLYDALKKLM